MVRVFVVSTFLFAAFVSILLVERSIAQTTMTYNAFIQQLALDSRTVDSQWTWRNVYPGRDTMEYAMRLLQSSNENGYSRQLTLQQNPATIDWRTATAPRWNGSVLADNELPPPHVYAIVIRPPQDTVKLGDALLMYGTPLSGPNASGKTRNLCFEQGICITIDGGISQQARRLFPDDEVLSISYLPARVVKRSLADMWRWQGLRRY